MINTSRTAIEAALSGSMNIPPNYFLWLAKGAVTAEEAAALFVIIDPPSLVLGRLNSNKRDDYQRFLNFASCNQPKPLLAWFKDVKEALDIPRDVRDILKAFEANGSLVDKHPVPVPVQRDVTLLSTIVALLAAWPGGKHPSGKELEKSAQSVGVQISDDSIRKVLELAKNLAPSLKKMPSRQNGTPT